MNKLTSATKLLGYDYYTLPFCRVSTNAPSAYVFISHHSLASQPTSYVDDVIPNLGESITGETYHSTAYEVCSRAYT